MKKFFITLVTLISIFIAVSVFLSSDYFFNNYIAKNIKEYGFNYTYAKGALFRGFLIKGLKYKEKELSSNVELKINPMKLFSGVISVNRLHLIGVNKHTLNSVISDFQPKEGDNKKSNSSININFEFKDILLTMKPFKIDIIKVKSADLSVDYLKYKNSKFDIGNLKYKMDTDIGKFSFLGKYIKKALYINSIEVDKFKMNKIISFIDKLKNSADSNYNSDRNSSNILNSPFTPKSIVINSAKIKLEPFKYENTLIENIDIYAKNTILNIEKLQLEKANLGLAYRSNDANFAFNLIYKDSILDINNLAIDIKNSNNLEKLISKLSSNKAENNSSNSDFNKNLIPIDSIKVSSAEIKLHNYKYKNETINADAIINDLTIPFDKNISLEGLRLNINSSNSKLKLKANINKNITIQNLMISSKNLDNLIALIPKESNKTNNNSNYLKIPNILKVNNLKVNFNTLTFEPYKIKNGNISANNLFLDINKSLINSGKATVNVNSNWGDFSLKGKLNKNNFYSKGWLKLKEQLFKEYNLPFNAKNIDILNVDGRFGLKSLDLNTTLSGEDILTKGIKLSIIKSKNRIKYDYIKNSVMYDIDAKVKTPYSKNVHLINSLKYINKKLVYSGKLKPSFEDINNGAIKKILNNLDINYKGDLKKLDIKLKSRELVGNILINDYKNININLKNSSSIIINNYYKQNGILKDLKISNLNISSKTNIDNISSIKGIINLQSNFLNLKGDWSYSKSLNSNLDINIPKNTILLKNIKNINYDAINNFKVKTSFNNSLNVEIKNPYINSNIKYSIKSSDIVSKINIGNIVLKADGKLNNININLNTNSIKKSLQSINKIYKIDLGANSIDGVLKAKITISNLSRVKFISTSPHLSYKNREKVTSIDNISIEGEYENSLLKINRYRLKYDVYDIYANRASNIKIDKDKLIFSSFWINDSLEVNGNYNLTLKQGKLSLKSNNFNINSDKGNLSLYINTKLNIKKEKKELVGNIKILNGKISSAITRKNVAENKDIVIIQRKREKENTDFAKNVKLNIKIKSIKPIIYANDGSYFKIATDIKIVKNYKELSNFTGSIKIKKGSYYILSGKKLIVKKGLITFNGKSTSPNLNIVLEYKGEAYKIYINVSGTPTRPILFFTSNPPLAKEQILAYLLFDDSSAVGTHSESSMLNMIGGSLAKSFLSSIGIKIDHISVKENGFSIGKNISKNITVYYKQDSEDSSIKTKIDITKSINAEIELGKDRQSADIIFSKEY